MKINAINNYKFNTIHFESKKDKHVTAPVHTPSAMKAVPVALLIAMSPVNMPSHAKAQEPQVVEASAKTDRLVFCTSFPNATPNNEYECRLCGYDTDNVTSTVDKLKLVFDKEYKVVLNPCEVEWNYERNTIELKALRQEVNQRQGRNGNVISTENRYYMFGPGTKEIYTLGDDNDVQLIESQKSDNMKFEISEELYKYLADHTMHDNNGCKQAK